MARDLIVFGEDWGGLPSSTQHLIRELKLSRKVLWVNSIGLRQPKFTVRDVSRVFKKLWAWWCTRDANSSKSGSDDNEFTVINPLTLPAPKSKLARKLAAKLLAYQLKPRINQMGLERPILWTSLPMPSDIIDSLPSMPIVYYCGDDFSALAGVDHQTASRYEEELTQKADLIVAASDNLVNRFPVRKTQLLTHGVDVELFSKPVPKAKDLPQNGKPIAGFYGSLSEWINLELLETVIKMVPDWHFVFIGKQSVDMSRLAVLPNVSLLGPKPHHQLPSYSQHWQVSLLPFVDNGQIRACNPLKLKEYLLAGAPVISTPFPALEPFRDWINVIRTPNELVEALRRIQFKTPKSRAPINLLDQGWQQKAEQAADWMERL